MLYNKFSQSLGNKHACMDIVMHGPHTLTVLTAYTQSCIATYFLNGNISGSGSGMTGSNPDPDPDPNPEP